MNPEQYKDLVVFTAFKAMQFELAAVQATQQAQQLAGLLDKARQETGEAALKADSEAIKRLRTVEGFLGALTPPDRPSPWCIDDLLKHNIVLMPSAADMAASLK